ncbi:MAG: lipoprotein [Pseudomonadota bacterium]|nr:lipoprotein [Pseudomonadota bacterium]
MKIRFTGLLLLTSLFLLSACGQKGPLYLEKTSASNTATGELEKDAAMDKTDSTSSTDKEVQTENKD